MVLLCLGIGSAALYRAHLMPLAVQSMQDRHLARSPEYKPLMGEKGDEKLPEFHLTDSDGVPYDWSGLSGKVVFLNFWTTWCTTCIVEMPAMEKLHQALKEKDFVMLAVNIKEPGSRVKNYVGSNNLTFTVLLDPDGDVAGRLNVYAIPTTFIYGKSGQLLDTVVGARAWDSKTAIRQFRRVIDNDAATFKFQSH